MWSILISLLRHIADPKVLGVRLFFFLGINGKQEKPRYDFKLAKFIIYKYMHTDKHLYVCANNY